MKSGRKTLGILVVGIWMINTVMAIGGSIFIVTLVIIQKSKYEDIGVSGDSEHYVKVFNELINEQ